MPRTLKDLSESKKAIRQEAIAWIKEFYRTNPEKHWEKWEQYCLTCGCVVESCFDETHEKHLTLNSSDPYEPNGMAESIKWIKHFFNISDEDLE